MKRSFAIILFLFSFSVVAQTKTQTKITTVYTTESGEKYHKSSCRYLAKSKIETTLAQAKKNGYEACKVCKPSGGIDSAKSKSPASDGRCTAKTKAGTRCKRNAASGSSKCWQH